LLLAKPMGFELFSVGAMLFCICVAPAGMTRLPQPALTHVPALRLRRLFQISPVGTAGCITVGLANGAFWVLAPVYAHSLGFSTRELALFMSVFIAGGALVQWPLGRFSDRLDRRWVIAVVCATGCVVAIALALLGATPWRASVWLYVLIGIFGGAMLQVYSLSIAHANDRLPRAEFVEASAGLLLINAGASIAGPVLGSLVTSIAGLQALFLYTAVIHASMAIFTSTRILARRAPQDETREPFEPVPQGSPAMLPLDPRAPEHAD
jgi:MFS family permease